MSGPRAPAALPTDDGGLLHPGERALHARLGRGAAVARRAARMIHDHMPPAHQQLLAARRGLVLGTVDPEGRPWATVIAGPPGFVRPRGPQVLGLAATLPPADPAAAGLAEGAAVGLLAIDLETRQRCRLNGGLHRVPGGWEVAVAQCFGNCSQHIRRRRLAWGPRQDGPGQRWRGLPPGAAARLAAADTVFVATLADRPAGREVDVSHRGGPPGFIAVAGNRLTVPDYRGNQLYNTLGNILVRPVAGLCLVDFARGGLLQLTGRARLRDGPAGGRPEAWELDVTETVWRPGGLGLLGSVLT